MASLIERMKMRKNAVVGGGANWATPEKRRKSREIILTNRWDERVWDEARPTEPVDKLIADLSIGDEHHGGHRRGFEPAPELTKAMFHTFYKANARLENPRHLERELYAAHKIVQEMQANPKLQELQEYTAGDPVMATVALDAMGDQLKEIIGRIPPPPPPPQPKPKKKKGGGQSGEGDPSPGDDETESQQEGGGHPGEGDGDGEGEGQPGQGQPGGDQEGEGEGEGQGQGEGQGDDFDPGKSDGSEHEQDLNNEDGDDEFDPDAEDAMDQAEADWESAFDEALHDAGLDRLVNKALDAAHDEADELENLRKGIGLEDGEWQSMSPEERMAMAERLRTQNMKELADVVGQMKRFALGEKATRINDVPHEIYDVTAGNELLDVLKPQFALLGNPLTRPEFYRRYVEKELLVYKKRGTEEVGKGPIVIAIDKSGSMGGKPFMWAMGVAEALRRFAADEDRDYYAMFFGSNNDRNRFDFPEGKGPFEKVLAFLGTVANGGTQFDGVLTEALERASKTYDTEGKGKADIVFITDGMAHLDDSWIKGFNEERERVGVRVFSVYIGGAYDMRYNSGPVGLLSKISDVVIPVSELKPESAAEIFQKV